MKNMKNLLLMSCLIFCLAGCQDWLTIQPETQVTKEDMFKTQGGFYDALIGCYTLMRDNYSPDASMVVGGVEYMANLWITATDGGTAYDFASHDYRADLVEMNLSQLFLKQYEIIANVNTLLEYIDIQNNVLTEDEEDLYKGEALGLRGFLHFDLLRLFGASYAEDPAKKAIPYVTEYTPEVFPQKTVAEIVDMVLVDLGNAAEYLKSDPIYTGKAIAETTDNGYLMNRQVHLNYYAVKGLMARAYLYKKDYQNAIRCAMEVIESGKFEWVKQSNLTNEKMADLSFSSEHLFALNVVTLESRAETYFSGSNSAFALDESSLLDYYEGTQDYRYLYQFKSGTGLSAGMHYLKKYDQLSGDGSTVWPVAYRNKMPLMRLSEMYYILAESRYHTSGEDRKSVV